MRYINNEHTQLLAHIKTDKRIAYTINFHNFTNKSKKQIL
jgi:hypothetical protein